MTDDETKQDNRYARLTARQRQVVRLVDEGLKPGQIAQRLDRSPSSVYEMLTRIQTRLGVDTWEEISELRTAQTPQSGPKYST